MPNPLSYGRAGGRPGFTNVRQSFASAAVAGPFSDTARWTYTVPSGRRAMVRGFSLFVITVTASGTPGVGRAHVDYTGPVVGWYAGLWPTVVGSHNELGGVGGGSELVAGEQLVGYTGDGSTGGSNIYLVAAVAGEWIDSR